LKGSTFRQPEELSDRSGNQGISMTFRSLLAAGLTFAALMAPMATFAQDSSASSAEPSEILSPSGQAGTPTAEGGAPQNWAKVCEPKEDGTKFCVVYQVVVSQNNQFLGQFVLRDDPGQESRLVAIAAVPLGVLLPFGMTWQIDGAKPIRVPYMLCDLRSCSTQLVINEAYVNSLKKGNKLMLTAKNRRNEDLTITINLAGFTSTYDGETSLTIEEYNKVTSGEAALERILQERAEAAAKKLGDGSTPSEAPPAQ
jgi:invasion protein IalB